MKPKVFLTRRLPPAVMARLARFCRERQAFSHQTETVPSTGVLFSAHSLYRTANRMFGGWGVYVDDVFIAIVAGDTLWLEVDEGNRADYDAAGAPAFRPFADRDTVMSYREVPADVLDDRLAIVEWARKAMEAARRSGTKPKRRGARTTRRSD